MKTELSSDQNRSEVLRHFLSDISKGLFMVYDRMDGGSCYCAELVTIALFHT